jgi:hypothetical protein
MRPPGHGDEFVDQVGQLIPWRNPVLWRGIPPVVVPVVVVAELLSGGAGGAELEEAIDFSGAT